MRQLTLDEVESLLPAISQAWRGQQYPRTLSFAYKGLLDRGRPPTMVYLVIAQFVEIWVLEHLIEEHDATIEHPATPMIVCALMDDVVQAAKEIKIET